MAVLDEDARGPAVVARHELYTLIYTDMKREMGRGNRRRSQKWSRAETFGDRKSGDGQPLDSAFSREILFFFVRHAARANDDEELV